MPDATTKKASHRNTERYECPPFFSARICCGGNVDEQAAVEDLGLRGLRVNTSQNFEAGARADIELKSEYASPIRIRGRVTWFNPSQDEDCPHAAGFSISRVGMLDWFKLLRLIARIKKEVW